MATFVESPTILVGAHNNSWTLTITGDMRYVFSGRNAIVDRSDPKRRWLAPDSFTEDYAIVSRVLNSKTGTTVIAVAGIGYAGTEAAAEFLTNPQSISALVKSLPKRLGKEKHSDCLAHQRHQPASQPSRCCCHLLLVVGLVRPIPGRE